MNEYHIAQVNIGRILAELNDPVMTRFVNRLDEINALADASPGFVWRLIVNDGNATYLRPFGDPRMLLNMSVWETVEQLRRFVYRTMHVELIRERHAWFEKLAGTYTALWWVPVGHIPSVNEARRRLEHLGEHGPTEFAFTFQAIVPPSEDFQQGIDWTSFRSCPAL
jgi:hypothetical protein